MHPPQNSSADVSEGGERKIEGVGQPRHHNQEGRRPLPLHVGARRQRADNAIQPGGWSIARDQGDAELGGVGDGAAGASVVPVHSGCAAHRRATRERGARASGAGDGAARMGWGRKEGGRR